MIVVSEDDLNKVPPPEVPVESQPHTDPEQGVHFRSDWKDVTVEFDKYRSLYNKKDLVALLSKYLVSADGDPYAPSELSGLDTWVLRKMWYKHKPEGFYWSPGDIASFDKSHPGFARIATDGVEGPMVSMIVSDSSVDGKTMESIEKYFRKDLGLGPKLISFTPTGRQVWTITSIQAGLDKVKQVIQYMQGRGFEISIQDEVPATLDKVVVQVKMTYSSLNEVPQLQELINWLHTRTEDLKPLKGYGPEAYEVSNIDVKEGEWTLSITMVSSIVETFKGIIRKRTALGWPISLVE